MPLSPSSQPSQRAGSSHDNRLHTTIHDSTRDNIITFDSRSNLHILNSSSMLLKLCCFNVRGLTSNSHYIEKLLRDCDVIALSEHWLHDYNLNLIHKLNKDFKFFPMASPREEDPVYCVPRLIRGHGGVALGWRTSLDQFVSPLPFVSTCRMVGIEFNPTNFPLFIISVYLPSRYGCTDDFKEALDQLEAIIMLLPPGADIIIMGDFNADIGHLGGPQSSTVE